MALDFPTATSVGQIHNQNGYSFSWDGSKWQSIQGDVSVDLSASSVTGTLDVDHGGTGQTSYTDGELLIGNSSDNSLAKANLTAGSGVTIINGNGTIEISSTPGVSLGLAIALG